MSKSRNRPSEQSSQTQRSDLLRSLIVPKYIALDYKQTPTTAQVQRHQQQVVQWAIQSKIIAPKPQQSPFRAIFRPKVQVVNTFNKYQNVVKKTLCKSRSDRREALFAQGVAGAGRRRSPGQEGTYKRTQDSKISC